MRRVLRELFRLEQAHINSVDLIIRVQKKFGKTDFMLIQNEFDVLMRKLKSRIAPVMIQTSNIDSEIGLE